MGYGLGRSPLFVVASAGASVWYGVGDSLPSTPPRKFARVFGASDSPLGSKLYLMKPSARIARYKPS